MANLNVLSVLETPEKLTNGDHAGEDVEENNGGGIFKSRHWLDECFVDRAT